MKAPISSNMKGVSAEIAPVTLLHLPPVPGFLCYVVWRGRASSCALWSGFGQYAIAQKGSDGPVYERGLTQDGAPIH